MSELQMSLFGLGGKEKIEYDFIKSYEEEVKKLYEKIENKYGNFVALDTETTGFSPIKNELIEVSGIKYIDGIPSYVFSTLIRPKVVIPYRITEITGITNDMVNNAPIIEDVMSEFVDFVGENSIVAHNANFDYSFLQTYSNNSFTKNTVVDTVTLSRKMAPFLPNHKLGTVAKYIGIMEEGFHRAEFDCECCAKIYLKYIKEHLK